MKRMNAIHLDTFFGMSGQSVTNGLPPDIWVETPCLWLPMQGTPSASRIVVNTSGEVWLKTAKGTIIILK